MVDKKQEVKNELNRNFRSIAILLIVVLIINLDISIAKHLNFTQNAKIIWALDFGIYNALVSMLFSVVYYFFKGAKLRIEVNILNKKEDTNEITLRDAPEQIYVKLHVEGKYKNITPKIEIVFPDWIEVQSKPKPYLSFNEDKNIYFINLESLISNKEKIYSTVSITFDIINIEPEKNMELVEPTLKLDCLTKYLKVDLQKKGIKIQSK